MLHCLLLTAFYQRATALRASLCWCTSHFAQADLNGIAESSTPHIDQCEPPLVGFPLVRQGADLFLGCYRLRRSNAQISSWPSRFRRLSIRMLGFAVFVNS